MQRWKNTFWISAGILALAVLVGTFTPQAIAQIRAALVRDMDSPIRGTRHIENETFNFAASTFNFTETITPAVPAGKKFFLQSVHVHTLLTDGQSPMEVRLSISGVGAIGYVPQDLQAASSGNPSQRHFTGSINPNLLMSAGEGITIFAFRNDNLGSSGLNFTRVVLTGYFVDINP